MELTIQLSFKEVPGYWLISITNKAGNMLLCNVPLLKGGNLLAQYGYLDLGYLTVVEVNPTGKDYPGPEQLGTDFILIWGEDSE